MPTLEFQWEELDQFPPQIREAILRMVNQQEEKAAVKPEPRRSVQDRILHRTTDAEQQKRVDSQRNTAGGIVIPPINPQDLRLKGGSDER